MYTQGNQVTHEGHIWKAKWWTQGQAPGTTGQWGQWEDLGPCSTNPGDGAGDGDPGEGGTPPPDTPGTGDERIVGYFTNWGVYGRDYHVKNIKTSGAADHLTHIMYAYRDLLAALRTEFGDDLVTSAIPADATDGGKIDAANYAGGAEYLDWIMPMTYDYFGAWDKNGPTAPHSPLTSYQGIPIQGYDTTPGSSATGAALGTYEAGIEDYKVLAQRCPATGQVAGTSYGFCDGQWWSYDTPQDIIHKMNYANTENLGGAFFWELSGDTADGDLITAIATGLQ